MNHYPESDESVLVKHSQRVNGLVRHWQLAVTEAHVEHSASFLSTQPSMPGWLPEDNSRNGWEYTDIILLRSTRLLCPLSAISSSRGLMKLKVDREHN